MSAGQPYAFEALPLQESWGLEARLAALAASSQMEKALEGAGHFWQPLGWGPPGAMEVRQLSRG